VHKKGRIKRPFLATSQRLALTSLETRVALTDYEYFAATAHNLAVTVPLLRGLQRGKHLHGQLLKHTNNGSRKL
jgi:hypothetical protein